MVAITADLLRKKSEHNEGTLPELEEISLHQLEIEKIEVIGTLCRKLKILYLQNNIISKIENLNHLKEVEYINLALNNVTLIEGLSSCEFLNKLDLTVNFIPLSGLETSMNNLQANRNLKELYVVGNPFSDWPGHKDYIINALPWLEKLDGNRITKADRIKASQRVEERQEELDSLIVQEIISSKGKIEIEELDDDKQPYTPELRTEMYREMAEEKAEKEAREKDRLPRERKFDKEHEEAVAAARSKQFFPDGRVRQCNEGGLEFRFEEDKKCFYLVVALPRYVDTSLIDCEVFPKFVEIVFKNKVLRLSMPGDIEVQSDQAKCERSKVTGELKVIIPKAEESSILTVKAVGENTKKTSKICAEPSKTLGQQLLGEAVDIKTIYKGEENPNIADTPLLQIHSQINLAVREQTKIEAKLNLPSLEDDFDS